MSEKERVSFHFFYRRFVLTHKHFLAVQNSLNAVAFLYVPAGGKFCDRSSGAAVSVTWTRTTHCFVISIYR
jgi:hypothetical protein